VLNAIAIVWAAFEMVLFSMPAVLPTTPTTMNYAPVVFIAFGLMSAVWYLISGRFHYKGPEVPQNDSVEEVQASKKQDAKQNI